MTTPKRPLPEMVCLAAMAVGEDVSPIAVSLQSVAAGMQAIGAWVGLLARMGLLAAFSVRFL